MYIKYQKIFKQKSIINFHEYCTKLHILKPLFSKLWRNNKTRFYEMIFLSFLHYVLIFFRIH